MLATGTQCINLQDEGVYHLNLPASLSLSKTRDKIINKRIQIKRV